MFGVSDRLRRSYMNVKQLLPGVYVELGRRTDGTLKGTDLDLRELEIALLAEYFGTIACTTKRVLQHGRPTKYLDSYQLQLTTNRAVMRDGGEDSISFPVFGRLGCPCP